VTLLRDIVEWALGPQAKNVARPAFNHGNVYWIYGMPGIGKTSIAQSLCTRLQNRARLGGTFFCRRYDRGLSDPKGVIQMIIFQLATAWEPYAKLVTEKLRKKQSNQDLPDEELLSSLLKLLESVPNRPLHPLVVVIDALDQCGDAWARKQVLNSLTKAASRVSWLKLIITSRPEDDIQKFFKEFGTSNYQCSNLDQDQEAANDLRLFASSGFDSVAWYRTLPDGTQREGLLDKIVERSGGLFIFIDTICRFMKDVDDIEGFLKEIEAYTATSDDALVHLYDLYSKIVQSQIKEPDENFSSVIGVIAVSTSYRLLCDETIAKLLNLDPATVRSWVDRLDSLLCRDKDDKAGVYARHSSVIDYFTGSNCLPKLQINTQRAHRQLGQACVNIMIQELKFNICELEDSLIRNQDVYDLNGRINRSISDALQYSCMYWSNHICHPSQTPGPESYETLDRFVEDSRLLYWLEVLSLMEHVEGGESALQRVLLWAQVFQFPINSE
jgi:hypothetical protein